MTQLLKPSEAAPLILNRLTGKPGISPQRVQKLCEGGRIGQRVGGGWVISLEEIEAYNFTVKWDVQIKRLQEEKQKGGTKE